MMATTTRIRSVHVQRDPRRLVPARAVPAVRRGRAGGAHEHQDQQHADGDAAGHDDGDGRARTRDGYARQRRQRDSAAADDRRAWARATGAWPGRARSSTSSWTSSTRPGRASTSSRVDTHGLVGDLSGRGRRRWARSRSPRHWRDTLAVKLGGDVAVIPDRLALRARRVLRDRRRRRRLRQRRLRRAARCSAAASAARCVRALGGRDRLPAPPPGDRHRLRGERDASTSRCRPAPACRPTRDRHLQRALPRAAGAGRQRGYLQRDLPSTLSLALLYRFGRDRRASPDAASKEAPCDVRRSQCVRRGGRRAAGRARCSRGARAGRGGAAGAGGRRSRRRGRSRRCTCCCRRRS